MHLGVLTTLAAAVVIPQIVLAIVTVTDDETRAIIAGRPLMALELATAFAFWIALFAWPLSKLLSAINASRLVEITMDGVDVQERSILGAHAWSEPLEAYEGIVHRVRASLSGNRHELVLVHPMPSRSVLLMAGAALLDTEIMRLSRHLGVPLRQSRETRPEAVRSLTPSTALVTAAA